MTAVEEVEIEIGPPLRRVGAWRAAGRGWRVFVPVVVLLAVLQALMIVADPVPTLTVGFIALVVGSAAAVVLAVWWAVAAASAAVEGRGRVGWRHIWSRPIVVAWVIGVGVAAVAGSLLATWVSPVVLIMGAFLLPSAAAGRPAVIGALTTFRCAPVRSLLLVVVALVLAVVSVALAFVLGLFVTGWLAAGLLWLWLGTAGSVLICRYCVIA